MTQSAKRPFADLAAPQQAGILCNDPRFQRFAATRCGLPGTQFTASAAAHYLRDCCLISSRSELAINPRAQQKFQILRTEFDAWIGRISRPWHP